MEDRITRWFRLGAPAVLVTFLLVLLGGCVHHVHSEPERSIHGRGHGPPAHAPAHGHRKKGRSGDVELVFDAGLGVYIVVDRPGYYWHRDRFLHWSSGRWRVSHRMDDGWVLVSIDAVPAALVARHHKHYGKKKRHKRRAWPAKRAH